MSKEISDANYQQQIASFFTHIVTDLNEVKTDGFLAAFQAWAGKLGDSDCHDQTSYTFLDGQSYVMKDADQLKDGRNLIHFMIQQTELSSLHASARAADLIRALVAALPELAVERYQSDPEGPPESGLEALELASRNPKCLEIAKALSEFLLGNNDNPALWDTDGLGAKCLRISINSDNFQCAQYLFQIMRQRLSAETLSAILHELDEAGLTMLHLALRRNRCSENQILFVETLIDFEPNILKAASGALTVDGKPIKGIKRSLTPYQYFLEARQHAGTSPSKERSNNTTTSIRRPGRPAESAHNITEEENLLASQTLEKLLKFSCMRHFGRNRETLRTLLDFKSQIHLDLNPRTEVTACLLNYIATIKVEESLQYVHIPNLRVLDIKNERLAKKPWWKSTSRKDYAYIFDWLRHTMSVSKIMRIKVDDDEECYHSDEVIENSLRGFDVEVWDWFKWDMCIDTINEAAPNVRELHLYWSGNKAILKYWAIGLAQLKKLEKVHILRQPSIESLARTRTVEEAFEEELRQAMGHPIPEIPVTIKSHERPVVMRQSGTYSRQMIEKKRMKERWVKCTEDFALLMEKWLVNEGNEKGRSLSDAKSIKVAVIDDGVNIDMDDISKSVVDGETFYVDEVQGNWPGFYQSSHGHGHAMSCIIRNLCRSVKLYVAKLNELWVNGQPQITPESATEAIRWATEKDVDIISMSWTIETVTGDAKTNLEEAIRNATKRGILLFSACDDQGNLNNLPYPAKAAEDDFFKIGSADRLGNRHETTGKFVDYIVPGLEDTAYLSDRIVDSGSAKPLFGSSIATARCAGLAAMILQCAVLLCPSEPKPKPELRKHENMKKMFGKMKDKNDQQNYIKVWEVFEKAMEKAGGGGNPEGAVLSNVAGDFLGSLGWQFGGASPTMY